jgi:hypothetical protein
MTEPKHPEEKLTESIEALLAEIARAVHVAADQHGATLLGIENLSLRMTILEQKISALAEQDARRREEVIEAIMQVLEPNKPEGGATRGTDGID